MTNKESLAMLFQMIKSLREAGNWTGETSIHKAFYILQKLMGVDVKYDFVLYLHGPFSFDLRDEISKYVAYDYIKLVYDSPKYGPKHDLTEVSMRFLDNNQSLVKKYVKQIETVCNLINCSTVSSLERLATALYVIKELDKKGESAAKKLRELKPHIKPDEAMNAVDEVTKWIERISDK